MTKQAKLQRDIDTLRESIELDWSIDTENKIISLCATKDEIYVISEKSLRKYDFFQKFHFFIEFNFYSNILMIRFGREINVLGIVKQLVNKENEIQIFKTKTLSKNLLFSQQLKKIHDFQFEKNLLAVFSEKGINVYLIQNEGDYQFILVSTILSIFTFQNYLNFTNYVSNQIHIDPHWATISVLTKVTIPLVENTYSLKLFNFSSQVDGPIRSIKCRFVTEPFKFQITNDLSTYLVLCQDNRIYLVDAYNGILMEDLNKKISYNSFFDFELSRTDDLIFCVSLKGIYIYDLEKELKNIQIAPISITKELKNSESIFLNENGVLLIDDKKIHFFKIMK